MKKTKNLTLELFKHVPNAPKMELGPIQNVLESHEIPPISPSPVGRLRLVQALRHKYGATYRTRPGVMKALDHFDSETRYVKAWFAQKGMRAKDGSS